MRLCNRDLRIHIIAYQNQILHQIGQSAVGKHNETCHRSGNTLSVAIGGARAVAAAVRIVCAAAAAAGTAAYAVGGLIALLGLHAAREELRDWIRIAFVKQLGLRRVYRLILTRTTSSKKLPDPPPPPPKLLPLGAAPPAPPLEPPASPAPPKLRNLLNRLLLCVRLHFVEVEWRKCGSKCVRLVQCSVVNFAIVSFVNRYR